MSTLFNYGALFASALLVAMPFSDTLSQTNDCKESIDLETRWMGACTHFTKLPCVYGENLSFPEDVMTTFENYGISLKIPYNSDYVITKDIAELLDGHEPLPDKDQRHDNPSYENYYMCSDKTGHRFEFEMSKSEYAGKRACFSTSFHITPKDHQYLGDMRLRMETDFQHGPINYDLKIYDDITGEELAHMNEEQEQLSNIPLMEHSMKAKHLRFDLRVYVDIPENIISNSDIIRLMPGIECPYNAQFAFDYLSLNTPFVNKISDRYCAGERASIRAMSFKEDAIYTWEHQVEGEWVKIPEQNIFGSSAEITVAQGLNSYRVYDANPKNQHLDYQDMATFEIAGIACVPEDCDEVVIECGDVQDYILTLPEGDCVAEIDLSEMWGKQDNRAFSICTNEYINPEITITDKYQDSNNTIPAFDNHVVILAGEYNIKYQYTKDLFCISRLKVIDNNVPLVDCDKIATSLIVQTLDYEPVYYEIEAPTAENWCTGERIYGVGVRDDGREMEEPFILGTTNITWIFTGANGNEMQCEQTVKVEKWEDSRTQVEIISADSEDTSVDVFDAKGMRVKSNVKRSKALEGLRKGIYIVGDEKTIK